MPYPQNCGGECPLYRAPQSTRVLGLSHHLDHGDGGNSAATAVSWNETISDNGTQSVYDSRSRSQGIILIPDNGQLQGD